MKSRDLHVKCCEQNDVPNTWFYKKITPVLHVKITCPTRDVHVPCFQPWKQDTWFHVISRVKLVSNWWGYNHVSDTWIQAIFTCQTCKFTCQSREFTCIHVPNTWLESCDWIHVLNTWNALIKATCLTHDLTRDCYQFDTWKSRLWHVLCTFLVSREGIGFSFYQRSPKSSQ